MNLCEKCGARDSLHNSGKNNSGSQRKACRVCGARSTEGSRARTFSKRDRIDAVMLYYAGFSSRDCSKILKVLRGVKVSHVTIMTLGQSTRRLACFIEAKSL